jgi:hypothetical protein
MLKLEWRRLEWWYWVVADVLLALALLVERHWFAPALAFNLLQAVHIAWRRDSLLHFSSQVRIGYLLWLVAGLLPGLFWMHWIQLAGTTAMISVGYCPLARMLSLLPWNRVHPFTLRLVLSTFLAPPRSGSIRDNPSITA